MGIHKERHTTAEASGPRDHEKAVHVIEANMSSGFLGSFLFFCGLHVVEQFEQLDICHGPLGWVGALQAPGGTWDCICQEVRPFCLETDASKNLALPILDLHILAVHGFDAAGAACTGSHGPKPHLGGQETSGGHAPSCFLLFWRTVFKHDYIRK